MLQAITIDNGALILNIDGAEYAEDEVLPGILTQQDVDQIRAIHPGALAGYEFAGGEE